MSQGSPSPWAAKSPTPSASNVLSLAGFVCLFAFRASALCRVGGVGDLPLNPVMGLSHMWIIASTKKCTSAFILKSPGFAPVTAWCRECIASRVHCMWPCGLGDEKNSRSSTKTHTAECCAMPRPWPCGAPRGPARAPCDARIDAISDAAWPFVRLSCASCGLCGGPGPGNRALEGPRGVSGDGGWHGGNPPRRLRA